MEFVMTGPQKRLLLFAAFVLFLSPALAVQSAEFVQFRPDKPNTVRFEPQKAKFLRLAIRSTNEGSACLDELEIFAPGDDKRENNLARSNGVKAAASSTIEGYPIHKIEHLNDGRYGNNASWVAAPSDADVWVQYEWPEVVEIASAVFSRDRERKFFDRLPLQVEVLLSDDGETWRSAAAVLGTMADVSNDLPTPYFSDWFWKLPETPSVDRALLPAKNAEQLAAAGFAEYDLKLRDAFLAEENALLKTSGFADIERWLLQRLYPEYVEPKLADENFLPLPTLADAPTFSNGESDETGKAFWSRTSGGSVRVFSPGNFESGPMLEQTVRGAVCGDALYLKISGNRFRSDCLALVSTENAPTRGFIRLQENRPVWEFVDPVGGRAAGEIVPLEGRFDEKTLTAAVRVPLEYLPAWEKRGLYVALGIRGRQTAPGGHPVHFRPADFSLSCAEEMTPDGGFILRAEAVGGKTVTLGDSKLEPNKPELIKLPKSFGQLGPENLCRLTDGNENEFQIVLFRYDPSFRPLAQLADMIARLESPTPDAADARDFKKRIALAGSVNPRYTKIEKTLAALNLPDEKTALDEFIDGVKKSGGESADPLCAEMKKELLPLLDEYRAQEKARFAGKADPTAERELFWKIRLLKRKMFLSNEELSPVEHLLVNKRHPFHPSHNYSDLFDSAWRPGGAVARIEIPRENGRLAPEKAATEEIISAKDGIIRNPSASFDAKKIYYAHRANKDEYFRIFEYDLASGQSRRISADGPFHDFWPTELPDGGLAFISTRCKKKFICWRPQAFVLHRMNKDGGEIKPLSFANLTEFAPSVMNDGRILWTRSEYVDKGADYGHTLWTIRVDGTMPELVFGNTINLPQGYANGREVPETREVCCVMISHFGDLNGPVALLDLTKGPHDPSAIQSITPEVPWPGFWARSETFREPFPITRDVMLVAHAPEDRFGTFLIDRFGNRELLTIDPAIDTICPQPFGAREMPPILTGVVKPDLAKKQLGQFSVANVYRGLENQVEPGKAKYLRVCQEMPTYLRAMPDGTFQTDHEPFMEWYASPVDILSGPFGWPSYVAKGVIGTVEIEKDGSADFLVPSNKVLFFQLLDENFNEIQRMRSVVQLQPGEVRSCIGCHESRLSTPEGSMSMASKQPARTLDPPPWGEGPFWFEKVVQPVLDKNCVACHTAETAAANPKQYDLTDRRDEANIPASYRSLVVSGDVHYFDYTWGAGKTTKADPYSFGVFKSRLWNEILQDEHHREVKLTEEENHALKCWVDLNVPLWGDYLFRRERDRFRPQDENRWKIGE